MKTIKEESTERYLVRLVTKAGGEIRKVVWPGRRGAPDRFVMLPKGCVWVELKKPNLAATFPANAHEHQQHREHERLRRFGQRVLVLDSREEVAALVEELS